MSAPKIVSVDEAKKLLDEGYVYVDVRSEPEFEAAHVPGALNVPLNHRAPQGMVPNPEFMSVMQAAFAKDEKLVVGCKSGGRSRRAVGLLEQAGFTDVVEMAAGIDGGRDAFGRALKGWVQEGLATEAGSPEGQRYSDVKQRSPGGA
ncbi:MAG TPA: rhodanese-like domain-containing protein [Polyangiaceae bacterium]